MRMLHLLLLLVLRLPVRLERLDVLLVASDDLLLPLHISLELLDQALLLRDDLLHGLQRSDDLLGGGLVGLGLVGHALDKGSQLLAGGAPREQVRLIVRQAVHVVEQALLVAGREGQLAVPWLELRVGRPVRRVALPLGRR